jgi:MFS family permease
MPWIHVLTEFFFFKNKNLGITSSILLPFVAFMVTDLFGYSSSDIGYYAGWLTSAYFLSQIFSSVILGQLSDIKGRRIIMLSGIAGNLVTTLVFGMSRVFWLALLSRFICGLINGNIGVLKSYIREITDQTNQAKAYTVRAVGWAIGTIVGPILGGGLARPAIQYPNLFSSTGLFGYFPFLLPCLASAILSGISLFLGMLYLKETVVFTITDDDDDEYSSDELEIAEVVTTSETSTKNSSNSPSPIPSPLMSSNVVPSSTTSKEANFISITDESVVPLEEKIFDPEPSSVGSQRRHRQLSRYASFKNFARQLYSRLGFFKKALGERDVVISILLYSAVAFVALGFDEVFAFWAIRPTSQGGVGFSTLQIGTAHAISGVGMLAMHIIAYVPLDRALGTQNTLTLSMAVSVPVFMLVSFASITADSKVGLWFFIGFVMMAKAGFGTIAFAAINILVSNAAGSETVGAVNGLSASTAAIGRVAAPVIVGSIFAVTANSSAGFPFDYHFVFFFIAALACIIAVMSHFALPETINRRKA